MEDMIESSTGGQKSSFTQPPMRRMPYNVLQMLFFVFFLFFFRPPQNMRQPFSGTAVRIFMKLLRNDSGENGVSIAVPKWGLGPRLIFGG